MGIKIIKEISAGIIGATGYAGSELLRLLYQHPKVKIKQLSSKSYNNQYYNTIYHNFNQICELECIEYDLNTMVEELDIIFFALPHGIVSKILTEYNLNDVKIIDFSADFRLKKAELYEKWYNFDHQNKELLNKAVYGLCELKRELIKKATLVAIPGCYPTVAILSLFPLIKEDLLEEGSIIIDAKSGVTGAGRVLNLNTHFSECNESIKAYNITSHRHTPEIEQELSELNNNPVTINFTPYLTPMNRGILSTCYATPKRPLSYEEIKKIYKKYYFNEFFIRLTNKGIFPETRWVKGSNYCDIGFTYDKRTNRIIVIGAIDNLIKGAAGLAVQNMNIMFGLDETLGLQSVPMFPV